MQEMSRFLQLLQVCSKCDAAFLIEERECTSCYVDKLLKEVLEVTLRRPASAAQRKRTRKRNRDAFFQKNSSL